MRCSPSFSRSSWVTTNTSFLDGNDDTDGVMKKSSDLIEDLLNVADAGDDTIHYGGTLLTIAMTPPVQGVIRYRVVDGQQRLTTISILLECIAQKLGPDGACGDWTAELIRTTLLTNPCSSTKTETQAISTTRRRKRICKRSQRSS